MEDFLKTISLESYIDHEKNFCDSLTREEIDNLDYAPLAYSKMKMEDSGDKPPDISDKTDGINEEVSQIMASVQADDFFLSLELQSSSKMSSSVINLPSLPSKASTGIVTRSRSHLPLSHDKASDKIRPKAKIREQRRKEGNQIKKVGKVKKEHGKVKKVNKKVIGKKAQNDKRFSLPSTETKKQQQLSAKFDESILIKNLGTDKCKDDEDWVLFQHLGMKKDGSMEDKLLVNELNATTRRCTPELFSMSPILMTDIMSEGKDEVDKLLEVDDYDEAFLEEIEEFSSAPPRTHTGGKWKPGSLLVRTSPVLWPSQHWENFVDDRNNYDSVGKIRSEITVELPNDGKCQSQMPTTGGKWKPLPPPASHTGGKWKPLTPPATYTGGKWKPSEVSQRNRKIQSEILLTEYGETAWKYESQSNSEPPINHTGGKWKPNSCPTVAQYKEDLSSATLKPDMSSSAHGKRMSGPKKNSLTRSTVDILVNCQSTSGKCLKTSGGMIQYYCSPCNRRLSSKKMYKNHVQSELHLKRVLQENDLEFDSRSLKMFRGLITQTGRKERGLGKRVVRQPETYKGSQPEPFRKGKEMMVKMKGKKIPRKEITKCEVCKIKVPSYQLGKHLVSYYHNRRMQLSDPSQRSLILSNIHAIVKQAPYQCSICKFYCNTHVMFKKHWALSAHKEVEGSENHRFWCSLCNFECQTSRSMELHLDSNSHREVIQAVNKSIPIIIRHKYVFSCSVCFKEFRFNRELIHHRQTFHPETLTDAISKFTCKMCSQNCKSMKSLQKHIIRSHQGDYKVPYFCSICNEFFATVTDAKNHRNGQQHKYKKSVAEGRESSQKKGLSRSCPYCAVVFDNLEKLKIHLYERHRPFLPKCIKCGSVFALSQEVSRHVKNKECDISGKGPRPPPLGAFTCDLCLFSTNSESEFLLHAAIHQKQPGEDKKIPCSLCGILFTQTALGIHLKTHLKEKTYQCSMCASTFVRKDRYVAHLKSKHFLKENEISRERDSAKREDETKAKQKEDETRGDVVYLKDGCDKVPTERMQLCGDTKCKYVAKDLKDLLNHGLVHVGPKVYQCPECPYYAKTNTVIKRHYMTHTDEKQFSCPHCPFKGRLKSHLKRHMRLHTGAKPYKCPHCPHTCNILENLRKHVLNTKIHPGKKLYECKLCPFDTNVSKDFKTHLSECHKDNCRSNEAILAAGIYNREEDLTSTINPILGDRRAFSHELPPKPQSSDVKRQMQSITQKFVPIAPKPILPDEKMKGPTLKSTGNSVEDKRKILEMELEKLKKQIKPEVKIPRSYPSPAEKGRFRVKNPTAEEDNARKTTTSKAGDREGDKDNAETKGIFLLNVLPTESDQSADSREDTQQQKESPTYILCDKNLAVKDNELYLMDNYHVCNS